MYRHPHQLVEGEPFHQDFDIYSFGFLPVMIARSWKIEDIPKMFNVRIGYAFHESKIVATSNYFIHSVKPFSNWIDRGSCGWKPRMFMIPIRSSRHPSILSIAAINELLLYGKFTGGGSTSVLPVSVGHNQTMSVVVTPKFKETAWSTHIIERVYDGVSVKSPFRFHCHKSDLKGWQPPVSLMHEMVSKLVIAAGRFLPPYPIPNERKTEAVNKLLWYKWRGWLLNLHSNMRHEVLFDRQNSSHSVYTIQLTHSTRWFRVALFYSQIPSNIRLMHDHIGCQPAPANGASRRTRMKTYCSWGGSIVGSPKKKHLLEIRRRLKYKVRDERKKKEFIDRKGFNGSKVQGMEGRDWIKEV